MYTVCCLKPSKCINAVYMIFLAEVVAIVYCRKIDHGRKVIVATPECPAQSAAKTLPYGLGFGC